MAGSRLLGPTDRLVFAGLCGYANRNGGPAWLRNRPSGFLAWPSVPTLSEDTGLSERAVQAGIKNLEAHGAIICVYRSAGGAPRSRRGAQPQPGRTNCYLLTPHQVHPLTPHEMHRSKGTKPRSSCNETVHVVQNNPAAGAPELIKKSYLEESTTTTRAREECSRSEPSGRVVAVDPSFKKPENEIADDPRDLERLQQLLTDQISHLGWVRIRNGAERHGYNMKQLYQAFRAHGGGMNKAGGLINFAETSMPSLVKSMTFWQCVECRDRGYTAGDVEEEPCTCAAAEKWHAEHPQYRLKREAEAAGLAWCRTCHNTGIYRGHPCPADDCEHGRHEELRRLQAHQKREEEKRAKQEETTRLREQRKSQGICPECADQAADSYCISCSGTKQYFSDYELARQDKCKHCHGTGKSCIGKACTPCKGTGKWSAWTDSKKRHEALQRTA